MAVQRLHIQKRYSEIAISGNLVHLAGQLAEEAHNKILRGKPNKHLP